MEKFFYERKNTLLRCSEKNSFLIKDIYEEMFKRIINPIYLVIISLISSLVILKSKLDFFQPYFKSILFLLGFIVILFSELSYRFISYTFFIEILFILMPLIFVFIFYLILLLKTKFKIQYL